MRELSTEILEKIQERGWSSDRQLDRNKVIEELRSYELPVFPAVISHLQEFGGLWLGYLNFDIEECALSPERIHHFSKFVNVQVCPIAKFKDFAVILIDEESQFYFYGWGGELALIAEDVDALLEHYPYDERFHEPIRRIEISLPPKVR